MSAVSDCSFMADCISVFIAAISSSYQLVLVSVLYSVRELPPVADIRFLNVLSALMLVLPPCVIMMFDWIKSV